ncbi:Mannitol-1-phosphate 5-dehydrogenase [Frankliniella fusca]|uniref:Mannitol-1-phosphate 5-dehydrogenase n=1 Tax=Frankliniella fusca TaxID=407009 RepID=A0AAE1L7Q3_9NEOP|nr:Mannitol-1-phosphate 5-dehydrogenase [Frankliniella fusca]
MDEYKPMDTKQREKCHKAETKSNVSALLKQADYVALTTYTWTSDAHDSYMSLTCLFVDKSCSVNTNVYIVHFD